MGALWMLKKSEFASLEIILLVANQEDHSLCEWKLLCTIQFVLIVHDVKEMTWRVPDH